MSMSKDYFQSRGQRMSLTDRHGKKFATVLKLSQDRVQRDTEWPCCQARVIVGVIRRTCVRCGHKRDRSKSDLEEVIWKQCWRKDKPMRTKRASREAGEAMKMPWDDARDSLLEATTGQTMLFPICFGPHIPFIITTEYEGNVRFWSGGANPFLLEAKIKFFWPRYLFGCSWLKH